MISGTTTGTLRNTGLSSSNKKITLIKKGKKEQLWHIAILMPKAKPIIYTQRM